LTSNSVPPSSEAPEEKEPQVVGQVRNRLECPSPIRKQPRTRCGDSPRECEKEGGRTNQGGNVARGSAAKKDGSGREEEDSKPSPVTSSSTAVARISSDTTQEVVQEEATPAACLPPGWTLQKVEPDW
jgi:hypothetical protein